MQVKDDGTDAGAVRPSDQALEGVETLLRHAVRSNAQAGTFTREIRRQSLGVEGSLAATRGSVGRDTATVTAERLRGELVGAVTEAMGTVTAEIGRIGRRIDEKAAAAAKVASTIDGIGATIRMLSLNATIEAARAGDNGRGFAIVAAEIRALADQTRESARQVGGTIDFSDVRLELQALRSSTDTAMETLRGAVRTTADRIEQLLGTVGTELAAISTSNASINEALGAMQACLDRTETKAERALALSGEGLAASRGGPAPGLARYGLIRREPGFDRLDAVLARGILRVAIEPAFKGLSFRTREGGPLVGLDVEYVQAFARRLGVRAEFVECAWDACTELLEAGRRPGETPADLVWSALPPSAAFEGVAYSRAYTYLHYVLARRAGDRRIGGLADLDGRTLGVINDPSAYATLEAAGIRWGDNLSARGRRVATLASLVPMTDQGRIHDALAEGIIDAFAVDAPIMHWACTDPASPWRGRIEILPGNLAPAPWYYAAAAADHPSSCRLLMAVDAFLDEFSGTAERRAIECRWQGAPVGGTAGYRDEPGNLRGSAELAVAYREDRGHPPGLPDFLSRQRAA